MSEPRAYYNDTDAAACAVLREQIRRGVIPFGDVDDRSIKDVSPDDLRGYTQCHFFAGGGLWGVAARLAGWPDERPLWTGSCPCQPYSVAGKGLGADDPRHLWPDFLRLIRAERPPVVMGEQVAGSAGYGWLDGVRADLAAENYASRGVDIPALAVDAPHERNRLYWVSVDGYLANTDCVGSPSDGRHTGEVGCVSEEECRAEHDTAISRRSHDSSFGHLAGPVRSMVDPSRLGWSEGRPEPGFHGRRSTSSISDAFGGGLVNGDHERREELRGPLSIREEQPRAERPDGRNGSFWAGAEWIACHDGKARRTKPGLPLLVDGFPGRVDLWRIAGNAISPVLAAEVIAAFMDAEAGL